MRTLAHLSDLHFGRVEHAALEPLRRRLEELAPDLVVVSGDLTQRARAPQFRAARAYLDTLPRPQVLVPGNHDVPLYNVLARFVRPLAGYRRIIARDVEPAYVDEEIAVLGVNTARSLAFKGGRVSDAQLARLREALRRLDRVTKIVVMHHPVMPAGDLSDCGVDVLISGHLHASAIVHRQGSALRVQAGTATSSRTRDEPNSFNVLRIAPRRVRIEHYALNGRAFVRAASETFSRQAHGWRRGGPP